MYPMMKLKKIGEQTVILRSKYLETITDEYRNWRMDCRLLEISTDICNDILKYWGDVIDITEWGVASDPKNSGGKRTYLYGKIK